jgi:signal transduction histidine kinase
MTLLLFAAALLTLATGAGILWSNPVRFTNRVFALASLCAAAWLYCVFQSLRIGELYPEIADANPVPWLRRLSAVGALFPWIIWLLLNAVTSTEGQQWQVVRKSWPWFVTALLLGGLALTNHFIPLDSTPDNPRRGPGYLVFTSISVVLYVFLMVVAYRHVRRATGIRRIELQFIAFNSALACLLAVTVTVIGTFLDNRPISRLSPLVILGFYILTVWSVTIHRVFDARQMFLSVGQRLFMVAVMTTGIYGGSLLLEPLLPAPLNLLACIAVCSVFAFTIDRRSRNWFNLSVWQNTLAIRKAVHDLTRRESDPNKLVAELEALLRGWCQTNYAAMLFDSGEIFVSGNIELAKDRSGFRALCKEGWSTPESLLRQRPEPGLVDLRQFLTEFNLGLLISAPRGSSTPSLLLALGVKTNYRPFTYPEVQQLQEVAEFMDNILARSRLSMQARQSEQLATIGLIGASLAHEIRNPLVSIKTFSHLLASRFDDPEFRRRFSILIPAEVERIDSLTQQLLDLSNPRRHQLERVSLHTIMQETTDLMLARAQEAKVSLTMQLDAAKDTIHADGSAIRQVLINLIINAFQALEHQENDRRVQLRSRNSPNGSVIIEVSDNGPGIAPEQRARLFHPFVSTKTKGMGLGLAVCADILHEHRATIIVPDIGRPGATFRITFPCPPPSS